MKRMLFVASVAALLASCSSADNKVPQISADFCDCFKKVEAGMSDESRKLFTTAAESADPQKTLTDDLLKLDPETQQKVAADFAILAELDDENSEIGSCIKGIEKKYNNQYTFNEKKFAAKIIKELESKQGCSFTASLMKLGVKEQEKQKN